ncbi:MULTISPECIES: hypothetical protein [unclassified Legionella]|uniref:hypothetical protein n=1 Tax=unclassified Legionella TaxID=2622702 RepID=UPI001E4F813F|nr:hypothetical protein [Legionella sp. 31fI33]MCC5015600.1 hypothetical protein [Legionella sp. 31fI33]
MVIVENPGLQPAACTQATHQTVSSSVALMQRSVIKGFTIVIVEIPGYSLRLAPRLPIKQSVVSSLDGA